MEQRSANSATWLMLFCFVLLVAMYLLAASGAPFSPAVVVLILIVCLFSMLQMISGSEHEHGVTREDTRAPGPDAPPPLELRDIIDVSAYKQAGENSIFHGTLRMEPDAAYDELQRRFQGSDFVPVLDEARDGKPFVLLTPASLWPKADAQATFPWANVALFVGTLLTTTWAGALHAGVNILADPSQFSVGLPYSLSLMAILGTHELGHYVAARWHGMRVSLPYFIPVPFALGTFGAFIRLKSPAEDRRALFDVAVAGPLAGLAIAIPALIIGLNKSEIIAVAPDGGTMHQGVGVGSSMLLAAIAKFSLGDTLTAGHVIRLHPMAFAGWLGLFITALNLLPVGQLDGGHIADAMFGTRRGAAVNRLVLLSLFFLGIFVWAGLLVWAFIIYMVGGGKGFTALNALTPVSRGRLAVGWLAYALLAAIVLPVPHTFYANFGIHCPYL